MFRKQFLLTKKTIHESNLVLTSNIGQFNLYLGADSTYNSMIKDNLEFHLLGSLYSWEFPELSNDQLLAKMSRQNTLDGVFEEVNNFCGEFVLIVKMSDELYIFNDTTSQKEVYYDSEYSSFGTQPKLLGKAIALKEHSAKDAVEFYSSPLFAKKRVFVGNTTHKENIYHLLPNHYLSLNAKAVNRFFPNEAIVNYGIEAAAKKAAEMLKGFMVAFSHRHKLKLGVTGGYDSRVLLLSSLDLDCQYYVSKYAYMNESHFDLAIPRRLSTYFNLGLKIEDSNLYDKSSDHESYENDVDHPSKLQVNKSEEGFVYINGNVSEIARNYYGYHKNASAKDLCFLSGYATLDYPTTAFAKWLENRAALEKFGYNYLDMFYWEERMGNWGAKGRTEFYALDRDIVSPFNSRGLLKVLLGTKRKNRDSHFNNLYDALVYELSGRNDELLAIPINPSRKQAVIKLLKQFKVYNVYRHIGVKTRKLNL